MSNEANKHSVSGIYSKQPWFVLSSAHYRTRVASVIPNVSHFYSFQMGMEGDVTISIPDGCVDILFDCNNDKPSALVAGTRLQADQTRFQQCHRYFGFRFAPGVIPDFLKVSAADLVGKEFDFLDVVANGHELVEKVAALNSFDDQVDLVSRFVNLNASRKLSNISTQAIAEILSRKGNVLVSELEQLTGYSRRTLERQFHADIGMSPKAFCRAIRCQSAVYEINHNEAIAFSDLAFDLGFSDQSHFLREFKKQVSTTPLEYKNQVLGETYLGRIHCD